MKFLYYRVLARPVCQLKFQKADSKRPKLTLKSQRKHFGTSQPLFISLIYSVIRAQTTATICRDPSLRAKMADATPACSALRETCHLPSFAFFEDFHDGVFLHAVLFRNLSTRKEKQDEFHFRDLVACTVRCSHA